MESFTSTTNNRINTDHQSAVQSQKAIKIVDNINFEGNASIVCIYSWGRG